jgi:hypothetical protein
VGTTWKTYPGLDYKENWGGRGIPQGLRSITLSKEDRVDVLGVDEWEIWPA